jgi:hypothetical protein
MTRCVRFGSKSAFDVDYACCYARALAASGIDPPYAVFVSLLDVENRELLHIRTTADTHAAERRVISVAMSLDHYVSQVHLRNFYSLALGERMYAFRAGRSTLGARELEERIEVPVVGCDERSDVCLAVRVSAVQKTSAPR